MSKGERILVSCGIIVLMVIGLNHYFVDKRIRHLERDVRELKVKYGQTN